MLTDPVSEVWIFTLQLRSSSQSAMESIESTPVNQLLWHFGRKDERKETLEYFHGSCGELYRGRCNQSRLFSIFFFHKDNLWQFSPQVPTPLIRQLFTLIYFKESSWVGKIQFLKRCWKHWHCYVRARAGKQVIRKKSCCIDAKEKCWRWGMRASKGRTAVDGLQKCEQEDRF